MFVLGFVSGSQAKSLDFNVSPTEHACRGEAFYLSSVLVGVKFSDQPDLRVSNTSSYPSAAFVWSTTRRRVAFRQQQVKAQKDGMSVMPRQSDVSVSSMTGPVRWVRARAGTREHLRGCPCANPPPQ